MAETNERKIGKVTPGTHLPVVSEQQFLDQRFDYALLLSWNYADFFLRNSPYVKQGGRFVLPLPKLTVA